MNDSNPNCIERAESISCLAAGLLSQSEEAELRQHLKECPSCRATYHQTLELTGQLEAASFEVVGTSSSLVENALRTIEPVEKAVASTKAHPNIIASSARRDRWSYIQTAIVFLVGIGLGMLVQLPTFNNNQPVDVPQNAVDEAPSNPPAHIVKTEIQRILESDEVLLIDRDVNGNVHWRRYDFTEANRAPEKNCLVPVDYSDGSQQFVLARIAYAACGVTWEEVMQQTAGHRDSIQKLEN